MIIPTLKKASVSAIKKEKFTRRVKKYSLLVTRNDMYSLYESDYPCFSLAENWLNFIGEKDYKWSLIELLDDGSMFFLVVVNNDVVYAEATNDMNEALIQASDVLYIVENESFEKTKGKEVNTFLNNFIDMPMKFIPSEECRTEFRLKPKKKNYLVIGLGVIALSLTGSLSFTLIPEPEKPPINIDPFLEYRGMLINSVSAAEVFDQGISLAAVASMLPLGWDLKQVSINSKKLRFRATKNGGSEKVLKTWIEQKKIPDQNVVITNDEVLVQFPLVSNLSEWNDKLINQQTTGSNLNANLSEVISKLGWDVSLMKSNKMGVVTRTIFNISKKGFLGELESLSNIANELPLSVESFILSPTASFGMFEMKISMSLLSSH